MIKVLSDYEIRHISGSLNKLVHAEYIFGELLTATAFGFGVYITIKFSHTTCWVYVKSECSPYQCDCFDQSRPMNVSCLDTYLNCKCV
jgi:hypothetical protein